MRIDFLKFEPQGLRKGLAKLVGGISFFLRCQLLMAQTDAYMIEVVADAEAPGIVEEETFAEPRAGLGTSVMTMPGAGQIGASRHGVRGTGRDTMLRYDQHRELSPPEHSTLRIGPLYSDLGISLSAGYRYTRFRGRGQDFLDGSRRGEVQKGGSEFPLTASLYLNNYMIITRRMDLSLNLRMSYYHYPLGTQEDRFLIDLTDEGIYATFSTQFHPGRDSRILLYDDILYLTDYIDTRGISDRLGGREYKLLRNTVGVDWDWRASPLDTFSASASRSDTIPQSKTFRSQRAVRYSEMAAYRRQINPYAAVGVLINASQSLAQTDERPDTYIHGYSVFSGVQLSETVSVDAAIGQQFSTVTGGDLEQSRSRSSLYGSLGIHHDLPGDRSQHATARRSLTEAFDGGVDMTDSFGYQLRWGGLWLPGNFTTDYLIADPQDPGRNGYRDWTSALNLSTQLTRVIPLRFRATYAMRFNEDLNRASPAGSEQGGAVDPDSRNDYQTLTLSLRTGFRVSEKINCTAYVQQARRTADDPNLEYTRDSLGITLTWGHRF